MPLNDLFIFGELPPRVWSLIFKCCNEFLLSMYSHKYSSENGSYTEFIKSKTNSRLSEFCSQLGQENPSNIVLNDLKFDFCAVIEIANSYLLDKDEITICHGDFCFSNILYDSRAQIIKVIDPRGYGMGEHPLSGYSSYDYSKFFHSIFGLYDFIIAGRFEITSNTQDCKIKFYEQSNLNEIQNEYLKVNSISTRQLQSLYAECIHLFLSMLPLHSDNPTRQLAMILNVYRMNDILKSMK